MEKKRKYEEIHDENNDSNVIISKHNNILNNENDGENKGTKKYKKSDDRDRRALSLCQPYAEAIVTGVKRCENRTKIIFKPKCGGEWIYIHASKSKPWELPSSIDDKVWPSRPDSNTLPRGAIVGVAYFEKVIKVEEIDWSCNDQRILSWVSGPFCYIIKYAHKFVHPLNCKGGLGLWKIPANIDLPDINFSELITEDTIKENKKEHYKQENILNFVEITQATVEEAATYLLLNDNILQLAIQSYIDNIK